MHITHLLLTFADEILSDPVLRQAYDHFGHRAVSRIRHNRYDSSSLYLVLSDLHQQGKTDEALETLITLLENSAREHRQKEWKFDADVQVNLHVNPAGTDEVIDVSGTSVSFTSSVPISELVDQNADDTTTHTNQQMQLTIGAQSYLEKGMGSTRGVLSALYKPSRQTFVSSDMTIGRNHLETSLSSRQHMASGTVVSAKVSRKHDFESDKNGDLSLAFTSFRSLSLIHGYKMNGMLALSFGFDPPSNLKLQYGQLSLTTWKVSTTDDSRKMRDKEDDESDSKSSKSKTNDPETIQSSSEHPPKLTAKLAIGQFPLEIGIEQDHLFDSPERSIEASIAYNPFSRSFRFKSLLSRDLSPRSSISIGVSHTGMQGLTCLLRYQRPELTLSVPIFVARFVAPNYWNRALSISIFSYLIDETIGELLESGSKGTMVTLDVHETIAVKEHAIFEEQQWMHSSHAQLNSSQQVLIIEQIAEAKREYEEPINGLIILRATYGSSSCSTSIDVTSALQFWVCNSQLVLPAYSKRMLLGFYDVNSHHEHISKVNSSILHDLVDYVNDFLSCFGIGQTNHQVETHCKENGSSEEDGSAVLTIRYKYEGIAYEIVIDDNQSLTVPSPEALKLGTVS